MSRASTADGYAEIARASEDGSRVLVATDQRLDAADTDAQADVSQRTAAGAFVLVSDNPTGPDADEPAYL